MSASVDRAKVFLPPITDQGKPSLADVLEELQLLKTGALTDAQGLAFTIQNTALGRR